MGLQWWNTLFFLQLLCQLCHHPLPVLPLQELKYALFTSGPLGGFDSSGAVPAIELAEEILNQNNSVLSGYRLAHTEVVDTMCDRRSSLDQFFDATSSSNPTILGLLGCGCSVASTPVAEIIHHTSISQIAYSSGTVELSDRLRFPNFFRTYPSDEELTPGIISVVKYYGWKRIAVITQQEDIFTDVFASLNRAFRSANITVKSRRVSDTIPVRGIGRPDRDFFFEEEDYRVFFLNMYSNVARHVICEAFKRGFTYPSYVWLSYGWYQDKWWTAEINPHTANCTDSQLAGFLERGIALQILPRAQDLDAMTDTGLSPNQFYDAYQSKLETVEAQMNNYTYMFGATLAYDALWTLAFAIDKTRQLIDTSTREGILNMTNCLGRDENLNITWELVPFENFTYSNELMGCVIRWSLQQTNFVGLSGPVKFDKSGTRVQSEIRVLQYRIADSDSTTNRSLHLELIAFTETSTRSVSLLYYIANESNSTVYPLSEGGIPPDGTPFAMVRTYYLELIIIYYITASLGLVFSTVCLIFNFTQRNKKLVRLTSPSLNYLIIIGAYVIYASIFVRIIPSTEYRVNAARCSINIILVNTGYCLCFGTVLSKMGRIYHIFHNPTTKKKTIKDWHLMAIALVVTGVGVLLGVLHVAIPQLRIDAFLRADKGYGTGTDEHGVRINHMTYQCGSTAELGIGAIWLILTYVYFALLQIIGIILAIQTRKVKVKVLNDSKYIAAMIYISSIVLLLLGIVTAVFATSINITEILFSGGLLFATSAFLCLVFIPKIVSLYRDPLGERIFDKSNSSNTILENTMGRSRSAQCINVCSPDSCTDDSSSKLVQLQLRVAELEGMLRENQLIDLGSSQTSMKSQERIQTTVSELMEVPPTTDRETQREAGRFHSADGDNELDGVTCTSE